MKVGITGLVIPQAWSLEETLSRITADGYEALELALRDTGWFTPDTGEASLRDVGRRAADSGVRIVSVCPAVSRRPDVMSADASVRKESAAMIVRFLRVAQLAGADTLTPTLFYDEAYRNAVRTMKRIAPAAEDMGMRVAIEYVWNKFLPSPMEFARFLDEVDSPNVGFYFDPGNMAVFGYPEHWVRILGRHLMAAHVKDFRRDGWQWKPLLEGDVDFPAVMRELRGIRFDGALVSEVGADLSPFDRTAESIRKIIAM